MNWGVVVLGLIILGFVSIVIGLALAIIDKIPRKWEK